MKTELEGQRFKKHLEKMVGLDATKCQILKLYFQFPKFIWQFINNLAYLSVPYIQK